jgi:hypothetical protein
MLANAFKYFQVACSCLQLLAVAWSCLELFNMGLLMCTAAVPARCGAPDAYHCHLMEVT